MFSTLSPGSPFWQPNGMAVWNALAELWREQNARRGYREVKTPILYDVELWKQSGHWDKFREHMYFTEVEDRPMGLKPMNCPAHILLYADERRSYRDLPIRYSEPGLVHRHEPSGTLHGLLRVRHITQDDAHIFCTPEQIEDEVLGCLDFGFYLYELFGFEPELELSTRPDKRLGSDEMWDQRRGGAGRALERRGLEYEINQGDGAFYGPKIDLHMTDSIGRSWQLGTVQLDYQMPERFDLHYTGADNAEHQPVMIHRALFGSFERFIGILIEHYAGEFPLWLAPVQAIVLPIADRHAEYARVGGRARCARPGLRAELDDRTESLGRKIRDAEVRKVPYMLVVGDREAEARHGGGARAPQGRRGRRRGRRVRRAPRARDRRALGLTAQRSPGRIRRCRDDERTAILAIVNAAAEAYRGVIPADRWREPYMPMRELDTEIAAGVAFWGYEADGALVGIMGIQPVRGFDLIRHAYVSPDSQRGGVGGALLEHLAHRTARRMLVGTWAAADWAIRFYCRHGFELVSPAPGRGAAREYVGSVPRFPRSLLPDGLFHVATRGVAKMAIYLDDNDRRNFLGLLASPCGIRMGMPRLLPDDDALPPRPRHHPREPLRRHADFERRLRAIVQREVRALGSRVRRPLLVACALRRRGTRDGSVSTC